MKKKFIIIVCIIVFILIHSIYENNQNRKIKELVEENKFYYTLIKEQINNMYNEQIDLESDDGIKKAKKDSEFFNKISSVYSEKYYDLNLYFKDDQKEITGYFSFIEKLRELLD